MRAATVADLRSHVPPQGFPFLHSPEARWFSGTFTTTHILEPGGRKSNNIVHHIVYSYSLGIKLKLFLAVIALGRYIQRLLFISNYS